MEASADGASTLISSSGTNIPATPTQIPLGRIGQRIESDGIDLMVTSARRQPIVPPLLMPQRGRTYLVVGLIEEEVDVSSLPDGFKCSEPFSVLAPETV